MEYLHHRTKMLLSSFLLFVGIIAMLYSVNIDNPAPINSVTQSQVVMQGHTSLQIIDNWYEVG